VNNKKLTIFVIVAAFLSVIVIACCGDLSGGGEEPPAPVTPAEPAEPSAPAPAPVPEAPAGGVTMANFNKVQTGMTYAEVCGIFGGPGEMMAQSEFMGTSSEIYSWDASSGFGNCTITFMNGKVQSKAQFGLE
jgi:hypothetical protein